LEYIKSSPNWHLEIHNPFINTVKAPYFRQAKMKIKLKELKYREIIAGTA
jgi:hypothetical protein